MKSFFLYFMLRIITGNSMMAIILILIIYGVLDRFYLGFLPNLNERFRKRRQIKSNLKLLNMNPHNSEAAYSLGVLYFERKNFKEAYKFFLHPKLKDNTSDNYLAYLGMALLEMKNSAEGKNLITKALENNPKVGYGLPYIYLIKNEMESGNYNGEVIEDLIGKLERFSNTENLYRLGMMYKKSGDKGKANKFFSKAISEYSYFPKGVKRIHRKWAFLSRINKIL